MTWEIASLLSVIVLCGTSIAVVYLLMPARIDREVSKRLHIALDDLRVLDTRIGVLETNQVSILKIAEDAKKLVSRENVAQSVSGIRLR